MKIIATAYPHGRADSADPLFTVTRQIAPVDFGVTEAVHAIGLAVAGAVAKALRRETGGGYEPTKPPFYVSVTFAD